MLTMIRRGSRGDEARVLQIQLNLDTAGEKLDLDGIFGPMTQERTLEFQRGNGLAADGIVGPLTWAALGKVRAAPGYETAETRPACGNCDVRNAQSGEAINGAVRSGALAGLFQTSAPAAVPVPAVGNSVTIAGISLTHLIGSTSEAAARAGYGNSLHYDRIFLSDGKGLEGRAFTIALPCPPQVVESLPFGGTVQVLNVGTAPSHDTLIHELAHAWQSQHHQEPKAYMINCVACQAAALVANEMIGFLDDSVKTHPRYPVSYPMSAYAHRPGMSLAAYGGEQVAQQFELGEAKIVKHMRGCGAGTPDFANTISLHKAHIRIADRRDPGVTT